METTFNTLSAVTLLALSLLAAGPVLAGDATPPPAVMPAEAAPGMAPGVAPELSPETAPEAASEAIPGEPPLPAPATPIKGLWVWHATYIFEPAEQDALLAFCQREGINRLLVQVHYDSSAQTIELNEPQRFADLIRKAAALGIAVEALDGEKSMAMAENQAHTLDVLRAILEFNASLPEGQRLAGIHYDIEPYLMQTWSDPAQRPTLMKDLLDYYTQAKQMIRESDPALTLACDIPFWFDLDTSEDGIPMALEYNGQTKPVQQHVQDICDYVGIMSYRTTATGPNSITDVAENEVAYAASIGKVACASVETVAYPPVPTISFHGETADTFREVFTEAWNTLRDRPGFGGMLIHCYPDVRHLLEADPAP